MLLDERLIDILEANEYEVFVGGSVEAVVVVICVVAVVFVVDAVVVVVDVDFDLRYSPREIILDNKMIK